MMRMIVDAHTHVLAQRDPVWWDFSTPFTGGQLIATMDRGYEVMGETRHVGKACVMTGLGVSSIGNVTMREAHEFVIQTVREHPDRLHLVAVINPRLWVPDQLSQLDDWQDDANLCMLKLHPTMHNYLLPMYAPYPAEQSKRWVYPVFEKARDLRVPVSIHMGEPPYAIPATIAPVAEAFPDVPIICAHSGADSVMSFAQDAILLARTHDNVYLGTSFVQPQDLTQMYYAVGPRKMVFESDCAPQSMGQQMRLVVNLHLAPPLGVSCPEDDIYLMLGGNISQLCRLQPDVRSQ